MSLTRSINDPKELLNIIKNDPELVVKVIKVANSSLFSPGKSITTINHSIVYSTSAAIVDRRVFR